MQIKIKSSSFLTWISLIILTVPEGFVSMFPSINTPLLGAGLLVLIFEIYIYITMSKQIRISKIIYFEVLFAVVLIVSTLLNQGDILRAIKIIYKIIVSSMWADICFQNDFKGSVRIVSCWIYFLLLINCLCSIVWPHGLRGTDYSFLTLINHMPMYWVAGFAFYYLHSYLAHKKIVASMLKISVLILIPSLIYDNITGLIALLFMLSACIWENCFKHKSRMKSIVFWMLVLVIGFSGLLLMNMHGSALLQKHWTLQARIGLWTRTMEMVSQQALFGWGVGETDAVIYYNQWLDYPPHNTFLTIALWGGICGLVLFIGVVITSMKGISKVQRKIGFPVLMSCVGYLLYLMMETTASMNFFFIFLLAVQHIKCNRLSVEVRK